MSDKQVSSGTFTDGTPARITARSPRARRRGIIAVAALAAAWLISGFFVSSVVDVIAFVVAGTAAVTVTRLYILPNYRTPEQHAKRVLRDR